MSDPRPTLGHYEILGPLGSGGMGEVHVARDPILGRKVAIKVLPARLATDRDSLTRFTQEARSASALNHPNIVTIYEVGADNGVPYIVMEHIEGRDIRSIIAEGALPARKVLDVAAQIADGLAAAHEQGIVHRDLKPENLMVTKDGFVKILDFGLAKLVRSAPADTDDTDDTLQLDVPGTTPGTILGTVGYMSPEQATGRRLDFRSDQFAFGAILYELSTGIPAFDRENAIDTLSAILHEEPKSIRDYNARAPAPFCWIVERLLSKDPEQRYSSTRDLARELRIMRDRMAAAGSSLEIPRPPLRIRARKRMAAAFGFGAAVLLGGAGIWYVGRQNAPQLPASGTSPGAATMAPPMPQKNYLAVLRFKEMGSDSNQLVADGIAETLTARLARLPGLQVMRAAGSSELLASDDVDRVGRNLGANLVLRGSMQRVGQRLRISYSIVDTRTRSDLTGDTIDGSTDDLFAVQDKLVASVAAALDPKAVVAKMPPLDPGISQKRFLEALGNLRRSDKEESIDAAIQTLEEIGNGTNSASVEAALGRAYLAKWVITRNHDLIDKASIYCERALAHDPQNADVHVTLGEARFRAGRNAESIQEYKRALEQQPNNVDAMIGWADALQASKRPEEAEETYKRAIALQPQFWSSYNHLGAFYSATAHYPESIKMFEKVIQLVPDNRFGYGNLGAAYQQMGRYDEAIGLITRALENKPSAQMYSNLGTCYYFLGRYKDSAETYKKSIELVPTSYRYWANLGDALRWMPGEEKGSKEAYRKAIALAENEVQSNPSDPGVRARLADCLAKTGKREQAIGMIDSALELDSKSKSGPVLFRAAMVSAVLHNYPQATARLREALARGYNRTEIDLEPEFSDLRHSEVFQKALRDGL
jgi:tetratricopeptide (TPR) repeat protein